jgi:hypothetical protein
MGAHLHNHYRRTKRYGAGNSHPDAGHFTGGSSPGLAIRRSGKGDFNPVSVRTNESLGNQPESEQSEEQRPNNNCAGGMNPWISGSSVVGSRFIELD